MTLQHRLQAKSLGSPDAKWESGVYRPGWRWSQDVRPLSGRDSAEHIGYVISGRMRVRAKDGAEVEIGPGEAFVAAPGHDAWVIGDEPCIALDFVTIQPGAPEPSIPSAGFKRHS
jgi:uncharacterized cupin superfamily protein